MERVRFGGEGRTRSRRARRGREREAQEVGCREGVEVKVGKLADILIVVLVTRDGGVLWLLLVGRVLKSMMSGS